MHSNQDRSQNAAYRLVWFIVAAAALFGVLLGINDRAAGLPIVEVGFVQRFTTQQGISPGGGPFFPDTSAPADSAPVHPWAP